MVMAYYGVDTDPERLNDAIGRAGYDASYCIKWSAVRDACHDEINQIEYDPGTVGFDETVTILSNGRMFLGASQSDGDNTKVRFSSLSEIRYPIRILLLSRTVFDHLLSKPSW